jgi:uncharacterized protein YjiS (DUF1127 family)
MKMSAQPASGPDVAMHAKLQEAVYRQPQQAVLFFGHMLDKQDLSNVPAAANEPYRTSLANTWHRAMSECGRLFGLALMWIQIWRDRAYSRHMLAELDAHLRKDIGVTDADVWRESNKPFWRI